MKPKFRIVFWDKIPEGFYLMCLNQEAEDLINKCHTSVWYTQYKP